MENLSCKESVNSLEDHIKFLWVNLLELKDIDLRPKAFISLIPKWLELNLTQGFESDM
ncbi:MAG: hypothetical protein ACEY3D_08185 [Rickettsia sp.]|uniref:hypothetical protein n=1 Tax=Rickettsia sp. TaxID=789 RepID=UPI00397D7FF9